MQTFVKQGWVVKDHFYEWKIFFVSSHHTSYKYFWDKRANKLITLTINEESLHAFFINLKHLKRESFLDYLFDAIFSRSVETLHWIFWVINIWHSYFGISIFDSHVDLDNGFGIYQCCPLMLQILFFPKR